MNHGDSSLGDMEGMVDSAATAPEKGAATKIGLRYGATLLFWSG
ncbi:MAG: hypothetical protein P9F75_14715 [Candidatus Contendobacter sp.]|nr:hypothetical protein [Candidatus Contendobacter sp.]